MQLLLEGEPNEMEPGRPALPPGLGLLLPQRIRRASVPEPGTGTRPRPAVQPGAKSISDSYFPCAPWEPTISKAGLTWSGTVSGTAFSA